MVLLTSEIKIISKFGSVHWNLNAMVVPIKGDKNAVIQFPSMRINHLFRIMLTKSSPCLSGFS